MRNRRSGWGVFLICTGLVVLLCTAIQIVRFSFLEYSDLYVGNPVEEQSIYPIWKVQHGHPLYEWPNQDYFFLTFYNYLFYYSYAAILSVFGVTDSGILFYGRFVTLIFALVGCIAQWQIMRYLVKQYDSPLVSIYLAMMAFMVWFGTTFGQWALYIRPDIPSAAITTLALLIYIRGSTSNTLRTIFISSCFFFLAWSFKQTSVWILAGTSLYALFYIRKWKQALTLILPCAFLMAICLLLGGEIYRYNILFAPSINAMSLGRAINHFFKPFLLPNLFILGFAPLLFITSGGRVLNTIWRRIDSSKVNPRYDPQSLYVLIIFITVVSVVMGFISVGRDGSNTNHLLEAFIAAAMLSSISLIKLFNLSGPKIRKRGLTLAIVLMLSMTLYPAAQLLFLNGVGPFLIPESQKYFVAQILPPPKEDYAQREAFAKFLKNIQKPLFIRDQVFALPWYATDNKYPTVIIDSLFYNKAKRKGLIQGRGLVDLVTRKHFHSLLVTKGDELYQPAIDAGYKIIGSPILLPSPLPDDASNKQLLLLTLEAVKSAG